MDTNFIPVHLPQLLRGQRVIGKQLIPSKEKSLTVPIIQLLQCFAKSHPLLRCPEGRFPEASLPIWGSLGHVGEREGILQIGDVLLYEPAGYVSRTATSLGNHVRDMALDEVIVLYCEQNFSVLGILWEKFEGELLVQFFDDIEADKSCKGRILASKRLETSRITAYEQLLFRSPWPPLP